MSFSFEYGGYKKDMFVLYWSIECGGWRMSG